jgi:hypothetical protein
MAPNRIMRGRSMRRALLTGATLALLAGALVACGGGSGDGTTDREADVRVLNEILARQLAAVEAYDQVLPALRGADLAAARQFRTQEQEHVNETTKTLRGLDGEADPPEETIEAPELKTRTDALEFLYELENATLDAELNAVARLTISWPRPALAIPEAFETGDVPAPEELAAASEEEAEP